MCEYYTDEQFKNNIVCKYWFSVILFNSRSLYANFQQIKEYLEKFPESFSVTAISETWIKNSKGADFQLHGYELEFRNRENKGGGGVTLYVNKDMKYTRTDVMSTAMDNLM